jgi:hypothetical protein
MVRCYSSWGRCRFEQHLLLLDQKTMMQFQQRFATGGRSRLAIGSADWRYREPNQDADRASLKSACQRRDCATRADQNNVNACEGLRHIMDASAQAAGHFNGSR